MKIQTATLTKSIFSTSIHPVTGQGVAEGILAVGSLIKEITEDSDSLGQPTWEFLASTDGGTTWFSERSHEEPVVAA